MSKQKIKVSLQVLENNYQLMCEPHERNLLIEAAEYLNGQLQEMRHNNPRTPLERLAIMGALQMAFDLQQEREILSKEVRMVNSVSERLSSALSSALSEDSPQTNS